MWGCAVPGPSFTMPCETESIHPCLSPRDFVSRASRTKPNQAGQLHFDGTANPWQPAGGTTASGRCSGGAGAACPEWQAALHCLSRCLSACLCLSVCLSVWHSTVHPPVVVVVEMVTMSSQQQSPEHDTADSIMESTDKVTTDTPAEPMAPTEPPPEKPSDVRRRTWVIVSFWLVVVLLGLPIWWTTTAIPRANLPLDEMLEWADGKVLHSPLLCWPSPGPLLTLPT